MERQSYLSSEFHNAIMFQEIKQQIHNFTYFVMHEKQHTVLLPKSNLYSDTKTVIAHF